MPVLATLRVKLRTCYKSKKMPKLDYEKCLKDNAVRMNLLRHFNNEITRRHANPPADNLNKFSNFQYAAKIAIQKCLILEDKKESKSWMTEEIINLFKKRGQKHRESDEYKRMGREIKKKCTNAHEDYLTEKCKIIEKSYNSNPKVVHQRTREISSKKYYKTTTGCIKDKNGNILFEEQTIKQRWTEYIKELYDDPERDGRLIKFNNDLSGPEITKSEVREAISSMKNGKAVGPDEIPVEVIKALGDSAVDVLHDLANTIYKTGEIPEILQKSVFITIPKKTGVTECENFTTIAIMSHVIKILLKICVLRMKNKIHLEIAEEQYGFQPDKSTRNAIFFLRMLSERAIEMQQDLHICFIDYKKAFDCLKHEMVLKKLQEVGIDDKDLRIIQNLYYEQEVSLRVGNAETETIPIKKGVRQGCVASPDLFNFYQEMIMRVTTNMAGIKVGGININNIRYADDTALIATSQVNLQRWTE